jgi:chromosome segregation ATPase
MQQLEQQIQHIHQKLQQLLKRHAALQKEKDQLQAQLTSVQSENVQRSQTIELLQQKVQVLQAAKGEMNEEEKKSFEKRLTQYIREIDRCIAMLGE